MKKKEIIQQNKKSFRSHNNEAYQNLRPSVVDWINQAGEVCGLKNLTIHAAIGFVDMLLDLTPVDVSRLQLVASACILISAKIEEQEDKVPRVQTLTNLSGNAISRDLVLRMESWILNAFKWEVMIITSMNFLEYYLPASLYPDELIKNAHVRNYENTKAHIYRTAEFLVDLSEHHYYFRGYLPSIVAAACVAVARNMLQIQPVWSAALQFATSYTLGEITDCTNNLLIFYRQTFPG